MHCQPLSNFYSISHHCKIVNCFYEITSETGDHVYVVEVLPVPLLMSDSGLQIIGDHTQVIIHIIHRVCPAMERAGYNHEVTVWTLQTCVRRFPFPPLAPGAGTLLSGHQGCQDTRIWRQRPQRTSPLSPRPQRGWRLGPRGCPRDLRGCDRCDDPRSHCCKHVCD